MNEITKLKEAVQIRKNLENKFMIEFGKKVKQKRLELGAKQEDISAIAGLGRTSITNIELGRQDPAFTTILFLAMALGCKATELIPDID